LLLDYFEDRGLPANYYIPNRMTEGYGLNEAAIRELQSRGTNLIITADCGTTSVREISLARDLGMDVIVVDHHEVPDDRPPATALLNPKRPDSDYGQAVLCTAGLAFKLVQALSNGVPHSLLDLVALGTIADVSPLTGENRFLVKAGLDRLSGNSRPGVEALKEVSGLREPTVRTGTVGFRFGPRINAAGRMETASSGVELLRSKSLSAARKIARDLDVQNRKRQEVEGAILEEAIHAWQNRPEEWGDSAIVLASRDWHPGVIGIVAARLAERFYRPAILMAVGPDGVAKGSARSIPGFDLFGAISRCREILLRFGGHRAAAGLSIREEQVPELRKRFSAAVSDLIGKDGFSPRQKVDAAVKWEDLSQDLARGLGALQPFG
ncbi:MAG TPA: single-stranded-DNA-specific exonuclease RecJ, partial [Nitrospiria bacterium]|nr:single-stranded-DNA-specific exonuclease RecJ [Nitrospiria bacterium]